MSAEVEVAANLETLAPGDFFSLCFLFRCGCRVCVCGDALTDVDVITCLEIQSWAVATAHSGFGNGPTKDYFSPGSGLLGLKIRF